MIRIAKPKTLENQHIVSLKIEIFVCIGSQFGECIDYATSIMMTDVGDELKVTNIHVSPISR